MQTKRLRNCATLMASVSLFALATAAQAQTLTGTGENGNTLTGVGDLAGGTTFSRSTAVSGDGSVVIGTAGPGAGVAEAFRWTADDGIVGLGDLPGGIFSSNGFAASFDGSVVVGFGTPAGGQEAFRWTEATGLVGLGDLPGGAFSSRAADVSADGTIIVGNGLSASGGEAFRWTEAGGMVGLGDLPGGGFFSGAEGISADGSVIAGFGTSASGQEAIRWTASTGLVGLGDLPGGSFGSAGTAISADGNVIVGFGQSANGNEAFRWTDAGGMVGLGDLPGGIFFSQAFGVSGDGSVVVGVSSIDGRSAAFRWLEGTGPGSGLRSVESLLEDDGVDIGGWQLEFAEDVSDAGNVIVGRGINPDGDQEGWVVVVNTGLITVSDFFGSLQSTAASANAAQISTETNLEHLIHIGRHFGMTPGRSNRAPQQVAWNTLFAFDSNEPLGGEDRRFSVWGLGGLNDQGGAGRDVDDLVGSFGFSHVLTPSMRAGVGINIADSDIELTDSGTTSDRNSIGVSLHGAFEPVSMPLRIYAGALASHLDEDIDRRYINGVTRVASRGSRDGTTYGAILQAGWEMNVADATSVMPFAGYQISHVDLDGYTETTGPLPATFGEASGTSHVSRLGAELTNWVTGSIALWGSAAWAHQYDDNGVIVSGSVPLLGSGFSFSDPGIRDDWGELKLGVSGNLSKRINANLALDVASDFDTDPSLGGTIGLNYKL